MTVQEAIENFTKALVKFQKETKERNPERKELMERMRKNYDNVVKANRKRG